MKDDPAGMGGSPPNEREQAQDIIYEWRDKLGITSMNISEGLYVHPRIILAMATELDEVKQSFEYFKGNATNALNEQERYWKEQLNAPVPE